MSYTPQEQDRRQPTGQDGEVRQKGSVRAARERLAQAQRAKQLAEGYEPQSYDQPYNPLASQYSTLRAPPRSQPPDTQFGALVDNVRNLPSPRQQWPLSTNSSAYPDERSYEYGRFNQRDQQTNQIERRLNAFVEPPAAQSWQDDDYLSPTFGSSRLTATSSRASDTSLGPIPDFPIPASSLTVPPPIPSLGPPPSARRGPSSYYSQISNVSPIKEESLSDNRASIKSYASSNVIPSNIPDFYLEDGETPSDDEGPYLDRYGKKKDLEKSPVTLLRQASLGKRGKPSLTTIKNGSSRKSGSPPDIPERGQLGVAPAVLDVSTSPSTSEESLVKKDERNESWRNSSQKKPPGPNATPKSEAEQILGGLEKGGSLAPGTAITLRQPQRNGLADRIGARRPPRLNVDAVRDAEARSSLTSLPDLIKRATRLAANLDRGKTASRIGTAWMTRDNRASRMSTASELEKRGMNGSVTDMLHAFPPPGTAPLTPGHEWPSYPGQPGTRDNGDDDADKPARSRKRVCGVSRQGCIAVAGLLLLLIAAGVVIPVVLVIIPKKNMETPGVMTKATCAKQTPCMNGGSSVVMSDSSCGCVCTNGATGVRCQNPSDVGCTTIAVPGAANATVGSQIPPLIKAASGNFSIPLNDAVILSQFAKWNMTCSAENALITFPGFNQKRSTYDLGPPATNLFFERQNMAMTSNGVIVAATAPAAANAANTDSLIVLPSPGTSAPGTNSTAREFAKVGILFVLQDSQAMNTAVKAQERLSTYLTSATKEGSAISVARNVTLSNGYFINLWDLTLTLPNGTIYGNGWNGTATSLPGTTRQAA